MIVDHSHRDLLAAVEALSKRYRLAGTYILPPKGYRVEVYVGPAETPAENAKNR
jgi:hypothetical protein